MATPPTISWPRRALGWFAERRREHELVLDEFSHTNLHRTRIGSLVVIPVNLAHVALFALAPGETAHQHPAWRGQIIAAHLVMAAVMAVLGGSSHVLLSGRPRPVLWRALAVVNAACVMLFGGALAVADQQVTPSITPIVITAVGVGTVFLFRPATALVLYGCCGSIAAAALALTQRDPSLLLTNRVNVLTATSVGCFLSVVLFRASTTNALLQRALRESHEQLERKREELAALNRGLEARIDEKAAELLARAREVESLAVQLQQRVHDRSKELAQALSLAHARERGVVDAGTLLGGRFRLLRQLAAGGMGAVFVGKDTATGADVAVKIIARRDMADAATLQRFLRESRAAARVEHPAVARTLHVDVSEDGVLFQVQELIDGATLAALIGAPGQGPRFEPREVARVGAVLADALRAAHASGVVHRDIKPGNLMLTALPPGLKLLDFGIAKVAEGDDAGLSVTREIVGTPEYMAPEQILSPSSIDDRADVYSLGLILYRMLSGRSPFDARNAGEFMQAHVVSTPAELDPAFDPTLASLLLRCLAKDARIRPSAFEVAVVLRALADALGAPPLEVCSQRWLVALTPLRTSLPGAPTI
jgi:serine/threonine-protein kinase